MKTKFTNDKSGHVSMEFDGDDYDGNTTRIERTFFCLISGGYVRELHSNGNASQVCDKLSMLGNTLICNSPDNLIAVIRREYRAMKRSIARDCI